MDLFTIVSSVLVAGLLLVVYLLTQVLKGIRLVLGSQMRVAEVTRELCVLLLLQSDAKSRTAQPESESGLNNTFH